MAHLTASPPDYPYPLRNGALKQDRDTDAMAQCASSASPARDAHLAVERLERENAELRASHYQLQKELHRALQEAETSKRFAIMLAAQLAP